MVHLAEHTNGTTMINTIGGWWWWWWTSSSSLWGSWHHGRRRSESCHQDGTPGLTIGVPHQALGGGAVGMENVSD